MSDLYIAMVEEKMIVFDIPCKTTKKGLNCSL
jgi:hypothetical protein